MVKNDLAHGKRPFARKYQQETMPTEKLSYALPLDMPGLPQERKRLWQTGKNRIARKGLVRSQPDGDSNPPVAAPESDGYTRGIILRRIRHRKQRGRNNRRTVQRYCNWD